MHYQFDRLINAFDDVLPSSYFDCSIFLPESPDDDPFDPLYLTISGQGKNLIDISLSDDDCFLVYGYHGGCIEQLFAYPAVRDLKPFVKKVMFIAYNLLSVSGRFKLK